MKILNYIKLVPGFLVAALLAFATMAAHADELTVNSILAAYRSGAPADGIIAMVNSPASTVSMTAADLLTLLNAGVPETVIAAIWTHILTPRQAPASLHPDDSLLVDLVRLITSGMSESIIAEQVKQSGHAYNLTVNDLLYLKQNGAQESTIAALMATRPSPATPILASSELVFDDLELVKGWLRKDRKGRLVMQGDTLSWVDSDDPKKNFTFHTPGIEKVWFTCDARSSGNFCYQINFQIVKGDTYHFRDSHRESGSNVAVVKVMEALRTYFPRLTFSTPSVSN